MPRGRQKKEAESLDQELEDQLSPTIHDIGWTDYVLSFLEEEEKIMGNPTTDGLRRIFEKVMDCEITHCDTNVVQSPSRDNEMRATVTHTLTYILNREHTEGSKTAFLNSRSVTGAADVYWGNCDKIFRNHPVAVAETRAEGRALRRALRLRKVVAAEEVAENIEDHVDGFTVDKITNNQINFMDVMARRLNVDMKKLIAKLDINEDNVYNIGYDNAIKISTALAEYQQKNDIPDEIIGFDPKWR
jgi:hypothetical protein